MIDLTGVQHHAAIEEMVNVLCSKTQNTDRGFFRVEAAYFLGKLAANMRAVIVTKDRGEVPVNIYALALATSGFGKGHSVNIVESDFMSGFKKRFMEDSFGVIAEKHLWEMARARAARNVSDEQEEYDTVESEYRRAGAFAYTFDSGTPPAVKQLRHKLQLANCGAVNLQIDEIGSNLFNSQELLTLFLELYDQGLVKQKLTKNTAENTRGEELDGKTPTNLLLFGTPSKLLDGGPNEDMFYSMLETGYARRCLFGWGQVDKKAGNVMSAAEVYAKLIDKSNVSSLQKWNAKFHKLADPAVFGWKMEVEDDVAIKLIEYKIACEQASDKLAEHEEIKKAEMNHRYFKALKLAGAYAFVDESNKVEMDHLLSAILLVEESGVAFQTILNREKTYVKLAKYIAAVNTDVTHADLHEALPFYKTGNAARNEMMQLATAWGYKKHIIIKKFFIDGIEFFRGESLKETNLSEMSLSYGDHWAYNYTHELVPFDQLQTLCQASQEDGSAMHWANHGFKNGHRAEENVVAGFNLIVIDVDGGVSLDTVHDLMKDYKFATYTTKRHGIPDDHGITHDRFRLIIPTNYVLNLDHDDYKEFMNNVMEWLPFASDESANQRAKKWETYAGGTFFQNLEGELLDVLPFIPKTSKNEQHREKMSEIQSMDNLERWFAQRIASGNRNNNMLKFAMALVDSGLDLLTVQRQVLAFNGKLNNPLTEQELNSTVLVSVAKKYHQ
ncbi:putative DNA primase [Burkholderia phage vB_BpP_HN04]|nr:putative DNA primase [Burkholderia phage vB_BpP_HN01]